MCSDLARQRRLMIVLGNRGACRTRSECLCTWGASCSTTTTSRSVMICIWGTGALFLRVGAHTKNSLPLSSERGTCKTVKAGFWPWLSIKVLEIFQVFHSSLFKAVGTLNYHHWEPHNLALTPSTHKPYAVRPALPFTPIRPASQLGA